MSDFTDDEDRQLVQLAASFSACGRNQISWDQLAACMSRSSHSKDELQQRLKTLKRTHGRDLRMFPPWFFRKPFAGVASRKRRAKTAITPPKRLLLPPLELVCRSNAAFIHHLCKESASWDPPCIIFPSRTYNEHSTAESKPVQVTSKTRKNSSDNIQHCRENGSGLSSLELLAEVAAQGSGHLPRI